MERQRFAGNAVEKNFLNIVNYRFGANQNEFIADEVFTGRPQNHHNIWIFDREIPKVG